MGLIYVNVNVSLPNRTAPADLGEDVRVLVDTDATLSVFPSDLLDRMGVQHIGQRRFRGFGATATRDVGNVNLTYDGVVAGVTVVFGDEGDPAAMGVTALESLGYHIDPVAEELHRVDMLT